MGPEDKNEFNGLIFCDSETGQEIRLNSFENFSVSFEPDDEKEDTEMEKETRIEELCRDYTNRKLAEMYIEEEKRADTIRAVVDSANITANKFKEMNTELMDILSDPKKLEKYCREHFTVGSYLTLYHLMKRCVEGKCENVDYGIMDREYGNTVPKRICRGDC